MESFPSGELGATAATAIATDGNLLITGHSLDIEMQQIPGERKFIAHDRRGGMQIPPTIQMSPPQNTTGGGGTEPGAVRDVISRLVLPSEIDHLRCQVRGSRARTTPWARRAVQQTGSPLALETVPPLSRSLGSDS